MINSNVLSHARNAVAKDARSYAFLYSAKRVPPDLHLKAAEVEALKSAECKTEKHAKGALVPVR